MKRLFIFILGFVIIFGPVMVVHAASSGLVPDCNVGGKEAIDTTLGGTGQYKKPCDFGALMLLINNVISFLLFTIATPLAALVVCYAGFLLISDGANESKRSEAKNMLKNVILGYIMGLIAWLVIKTIVTTLGFTGETYLIPN